MYFFFPFMMQNTVSPSDNAKPSMCKLTVIYCKTIFYQRNLSEMPFQNFCFYRRGVCILHATKNFYTYTYTLFVGPWDPFSNIAILHLYFNDTPQHFHGTQFKVNAVSKLFVVLNFTLGFII